jgi:hypothetical protein
LFGRPGVAAEDGFDAVEKLAGAERTACTLRSTQRIGQRGILARMQQRSKIRNPLQHRGGISQAVGSRGIEQGGDARPA